SSWCDKGKVSGVFLIIKRGIYSRGLSMFKMQHFGSRSKNVATYQLLHLVIAVVGVDIVVYIKLN
ncbi:MAG: hypothetical protein ACUVQP_11720, partial [Bacteroidales bacterium]